MRVEPVGTFAALAFHGLALVPLRGPSSLFDPRYVAWCRERMSADAREPLAADGSSIGAEIDRTNAAHGLAWLPLLHAELTAFDRTATRDLAELEAADVSDERALRAIPAAAPEGIEWLRADLLLASRAFAAEHARLATELRASCEAIADALSSVREAERPRVVRVAWALGAHGRAFDDHVVVGACAAWNGLDAATPAIIALHEHAVLTHPHDHDRREWMALQSVARMLHDGPDALRRAHTDWIASLELTDLADAAVARGAVSRSDAETIVASPRERASLLAALTPE